MPGKQDELWLVRRLPVEPEEQEPVTTEIRPAPRAKTRLDKKGVQVWLGRPAYRQLRLIAAREDLQIQDCMTEALDMFFEGRGEHRIAKG